MTDNTDRDRARAAAERTLAGIEESHKRAAEALEVRADRDRARGNSRIGLSPLT